MTLVRKYTRTKKTKIDKREPFEDAKLRERSLFEFGDSHIVFLKKKIKAAGETKENA